MVSWILDEAEPTRVMLIAEGTYPFYFGGVSTWCHQLVTELPEVEFTLYSIVADPWVKPYFTLPPNVVAHHSIPLWGVRETLESETGLSLGALHARKARTTEAAVRAELVPAFQAFLDALFDDAADLAAFGRTLHDLYRFFIGHDYDAAMRSRPVWDCFVAAMQQHYPPAAAARGWDPTDFTLAELTTALHYLSHWLYPLARPIPKTEVAHAAMAGLCSLVGVVAKLEHGAAFFLTEHGIYLRERYLAEAATTDSLFVKLFSLLLARRLTELSYAMADQISPCCDYNQRWELRNGATVDRLQTIYYGVDGTVFTPAGKPIGDPPVVVWVARINPLKDVKTLLRAAAIVHQSRPDIRFRLFGSAPAEDLGYYEECLALRAELGLDEAVIFAGHTSTPANAFNEGDLAVLSSISEGFPFTILEAMLCAKPVVATRVGGVPEQIEGCGLAVEPRNPEAMAAAILELMNDPARLAEWGQVARKKAMHEFGMRQVGDAHVSSYTRLASPFPARLEAADAVDAEPADTITRDLKPAATGAPARLDPWRSQPGAALRPAAIISGGSATTVLVGPRNWGEPATPATPRPATAPGKLYRLPLRRVAAMPSLSAAEAGGSARPWPAAERGPAASHGGSGVVGNAPVVLLPVGATGAGSLPVPAVQPVAGGPRQPAGPPRLTLVAAPADAGAARPARRRGRAPWQSDDEGAIAALADEVRRRAPRPVDALEVAAVLESAGMTDPTADERYGAPDLFALAEAVFEQLRARGVADGGGSGDGDGGPRLPRSTRRETLRDLAFGPLALLPGVLTLIAISLYGLIGGWEHHQVMALSLGCSLGMLVSGGFIQALNRRGSFYLALGHRGAVARFVRASSLVAALGIAALATSIHAAGTALDVGTPGDRLAFSLGFIGLAAIWLLAAGLCLVRLPGWLSLALAAGIAAGSAADRLAAPLTDAHIAFGSLAGLGLAVATLQLGLRRAFPKGKGGSAGLTLPPASYLWHEAAPYFAYGCLGMLFVLTPHVLGWLGATGMGEDRASAIATFETGVILALVPVVLAGGIAEYTLRRFWQRLTLGQRLTPAAEPHHFGAALAGFYRRERNRYLAGLAGMSAVSYVVFYALLTAGVLTAWLDRAAPETLQFICAMGLIACYLFGWGLFNCMFANTLGRPNLALRAIAAGLAATVTLGLPLSLGLHFSYAAVAFVVGAAIFVAVSARSAESLLQSADYHYFASL